MSKHNYSQYSNKKNRDYDAKAVSPKVKMESSPEVKPVLVTETVSTVALPKTVEGVVVNCAKLNVREEPNTEAEVVCVLDVTSEIEIDINASTNSWFKICTATGVEGYCMRKYVDAHL